MEFLWFLSSYRSDFLDTLFYGITFLGDELIIAGLICGIFWCYNKAFAYKLCFAYFASGIFVQGLKITFRVERPWIKDPSFNPVNQAISGATGYSFPSGHTQSCSSILSAIAFNIKKRWVTVLSFALIAAVGFSRMYLGVHTPADVFVSMAVSIIISFIACYICDNFNTLNGTRLGVAIFIVALSAGLGFYTYYLYILNLAPLDKLMDCFKLTGSGIGLGIAWYIENTYIRFSTRCVTLHGQLLKFICGISGTILIKVGLKFIIGDSIPANIFRYMLIMLWIICIYPIIIKKFQPHTFKR